MGHIILDKTCGEGAKTKTIDVNFLIMNALSPYNIILGRPAINALEEVVSTLYVILNYPLIGLRVSIT